MTITEIATIVGLTVMVVGLVAGIISFRPAVAKLLADTQYKVIETQKSQIDSQDSRLKTCEEENARLKREVTRLKKEIYGVRYVMKDLGYFITLEDDSVSVYDVSSRTSRTTPIRPLHKLATSVMPIEDEEEDGEALSAS